MTAQQIIDEIREELNTNPTKVTDAYLLKGLNLDYGETVMKILANRTDVNFNAKEVQADFYNTEGLVAGDVGFNGEYPFPCDLLKPQRIEISFDNTNWRKAETYDVTEGLNSEFNEAQINNEFSTYCPYVRFERNSFFIRPLLTSGATVKGGIHIWYEQRETALTISDTPSFIEMDYHRILALKGALRTARKFRNEYGGDFRGELKGEISQLMNSMLGYEKNRFKKNFRIKLSPVNYR